MSAMTAWKRYLKSLVVPAAALAVAVAFQPLAAAKDKEPDPQAAAQGPQANYSKEFRKLGAPVQALVNEKKWAEVLAALPQFDTLPAATPDDLKAIATWRLQASQGVGDDDAFAAAIEEFLAKGYAEPQNVGAMHRQLAAHYSAKKDTAKTLEHFQKYVDSDTEVAPDDFETLGRLYLQANQHAEACQTLGKAIELAKSRNEKPKEMWFQLRDRCFIETKDDASRLANLEALVSQYPDKEYYGRIVALYQAKSNDDRIVMLNAYRVAASDPAGGLATVGAYLGYADTALVSGSPGEAQRGLERGIKDGIVPNASANQQLVTQAKNAVASDKKSLPGEAASAAKNPKGEVDVKVGLGFFSTGDYAQAVELVRRGIAKGGVTRVDDANLLLGAALVELGKKDEARAAFEAAKAAAPAGSYLGRIADLWLARIAREGTAPAAGSSGE
jgi:tetratricopeptide (TPR) repeat protein